MPNSIMLAFTQPTSAETEDAYNEWYNNKHLHDVVAIEGVIAATRYKMANHIQIMEGVTGPSQSYLAIYELEAETEDDLDAFAKRLVHALETGGADISPNLDSAMLGASVGLPVSGRLDKMDLTRGSAS